MFIVLYCDTVSEGNDEFEKNSKPSYNQQSSPVLMKLKCDWTIQIEWIVKKKIHWVKRMEYVCDY